MNTSANNEYPVTAFIQKPPPKFCSVSLRKMRWLTPEFINFGIVYTAFMVALEYVFGGVNWYIARKTEAIADTEAKERKRSKLEWILISLTFAIVGGIGWLVL